MIEHEDDDEIKAKWNHVYVTLEISDSERTAEAISELLDLTPTYVFAKGACSESFPGIPIPETHWHIDTKRCYSSDVEENLQVLVDILEGRTQALLDLQNSGSKMQVSVSQCVWTESQYFEFNTELLQFFANYKLPLRFYYHHEVKPPNESWLRRTGKDPENLP